MRLYVPSRQECALVTQYDASILQFKRTTRESGVAFVDSPQAADAILLFEEWGTRFHNYRDVLAEEPLIRDHWQKVLTINCDDLGRGFLPGLYTSLNPRNFDPGMHRACAYPYVYNELLGQSGGDRCEPPSAAPILYSFRGTDLSHPIRTSLVKACVSDPLASIKVVRETFHKHDDAQKLAYIEEIRNSKFVLCPRGWSPASYRLFEVMQLGRAPVIIADDWLPIANVPWEDFAIRIRECDVSSVRSVLRQRAKEADALGHAARRAYEQFFAPDALFVFMLKAIRELAEMQVRADYRRTWDSRRFKSANGWLLTQRIRGRLVRSMLSAARQH